MTKTFRALLLVLGALALFATACSSKTAVVDSTGDTASDTNNAEQEPEPTSPPADEPAAAEPEVQDDVTDDVAVADDVTDEPADDTDEEDKPDTTTTEPANRAGAQVFNSASFSDDLTPEQLLCALEQLAGDSELFSRISAAPDMNDLSLEDQADVAIIAFDCAPEALAGDFSQALSEGAGGEITFPPEVGECFAEQMGPNNPDRRAVILGFSALGGEVPVPLNAQGPVVDTMITCIPGTVFADAVSEIALAEPGLEDALDTQCLSTSLDGESLRPMWQAMVENPAADFDTLDNAQLAPMMDAMFSCISFGKIMAAEAGIDLSQTTIDCIDEAMQDIDLLTMMETGEGAEEIGLAMLLCLSPEEIEAMG